MTKKIQILASLFSALLFVGCDSNPKDQSSDNTKNSAAENVNKASKAAIKSEDSDIRTSESIKRIQKAGISLNAEAGVSFEKAAEILDAIEATLDIRPMQAFPTEETLSLLQDLSISLESDEMDDITKNSFFFAMGLFVAEVVDSDYPFEFNDDFVRTGIRDLASVEVSSLLIAIEATSQGVRKSQAKSHLGRMAGELHLIGYQDALDAVVRNTYEADLFAASIESAVQHDDVLMDRTEESLSADQIRETILKDLEEDYTYRLNAYERSFDDIRADLVRRQIQALQELKNSDS